MFHEQDQVLFFMRFFKKLWRFFNRSRQIRCLPINHMLVRCLYQLTNIYLTGEGEVENEESHEKPSEKIDRTAFSRCDEHGPDCLRV